MRDLFRQGVIRACGQYAMSPCSHTRASEASEVNTKTFWEAWSRAWISTWQKNAIISGAELNTQEHIDELGQHHQADTQCAVPHGGDTLKHGRVSFEGSKSCTL